MKHMMRYTWMLVLAAALAIAAAVPASGAGASQSKPGSQPAATPTPVRVAAVLAPLPFVPYNEEHPVLAYYYSWWDAPNFSRTLYQPPEAYNSDDLAIMRRHIEQAQSAGIDGFVVSWLGIDNRTDRNLARLLDMAQPAGFRATIHFETSQFAPYGVSDVVAQLKAFYARRINHPALVRYDGRPVIFFWAARLYDNATWSDIRNQVDPGHAAVWIADGDNFNIIAGDAWDGISPYAIAWSVDPAGQLPRWGVKSRAVAPDKLYIPPVSPGCDDTAARPATCLKDRADGAYYQATLDGALISKAPWAVMVSTFNEWMESTQIETSVEYGDQYLRMTRAFADTYKGAATALPPMAPGAAPEQPAG